MGVDPGDYRWINHSWSGWVRNTGPLITERQDAVNLTTLDKVKALLELTQTDWDNLLEEIITSVSGRVAAYCNRDFEQKERVEYHDGGRQCLCLRGLPVVAITSIYGSDARQWDDETLIPADHYQLFAGGMVAYRFGKWPYGPKALKVTYTGGYAPDGVPADLEMAVRKQVAYEFHQLKDDPRSETRKWLREVEKILKRYRIKSIWSLVRTQIGSSSERRP
ncbi:MAG: hypothetical protein QW835_00395 [Candidatus Hadarchaeum sp.]